MSNFKNKRRKFGLIKTFGMVTFDKFFFYFSLFNSLFLFLCPFVATIVASSILGSFIIGPKKNSIRINFDKIFFTNFRFITAYCGAISSDSGWCFRNSVHQTVRNLSRDSRINLIQYIIRFVDFYQPKKYCPFTIFTLFYHTTHLISTST